MKLRRSTSNHMAMNAGEGSRVVQLDSLRGLAALGVVIHHHLLVFPSVLDLYKTGVPGFGESLLLFPPVYLLWAGHAAVVLFFVLSGYVLALPILQGRQPSYRIYAVRRFCRIYLPYAVAVAGAMLLASVIPHSETAGLSTWFRKSWNVPVDWARVIDHALLLPHFETAPFNGVIWSLVHEMRVSLVFPFLAVLVARQSWRRSLVLAAGLSLAGCYGPRLNWRLYSLTDYGSSAHYAGMFVVGAVMAKHRQQLAAWLASLRPSAVAGLVGFGALLYAADGLHPAARTHRIHQAEYLNAVGAVILIAYSASASWLRAAPLQWLGKISYSLYLWHIPVLYATFHLGYGRLPLWALVLWSMGLGIVISAAMYSLVEAPATRLAKNVGSRKRHPRQPDGVPALVALSPS